MHDRGGPCRPNIVIWMELPVMHDRGGPCRPNIVIWMELPGHLVVGQAVITPGDNHGAVARTLRNAIDNPTAGEPKQARRHPHRRPRSRRRSARRGRRNHPGHRRADSRAQRAVPDPDRFDARPQRGRTQLLRTRNASRPTPSICCSPPAVFPLRHHTLVPRRRQPDPAHEHPRARHRRRLPVGHRTAGPEPGRADLSLAR